LDAGTFISLSDGAGIAEAKSEAADCAIALATAEPDKLYFNAIVALAKAFACVGAAKTIRRIGSMSKHVATADCAIKARLRLRRAETTDVATGTVDAPARKLNRVDAVVNASGSVAAISLLLKVIPATPATYALPVASLGTFLNAVTAGNADGVVIASR
jgi:hypothetical protein